MLHNIHFDMPLIVTDPTLIGDTPELFVGTVAVIGVLAVLCLRPGLRTLAAVLAPVLVAGVLTASVRRVARRRNP